MVVVVVVVFDLVLVVDKVLLCLHKVGYLFFVALHLRQRLVFVAVVIVAKLGYLFLV